MRHPIAISLLLAGSVAFAQTPPPAPAPGSATPAPAGRRPAAAPARAGMVMTVTNTQGARLGGVQVEVLGASDRSGDTNAMGQIVFTGMQAGTYRVRFSGDGVVAFEKEVVLRAGQTGDVDITLNAAAPPPEPAPSPPPPEPAAPPPPPVGPAGEARTLSLVDLIERELIANNQPRRDTVVSCSGNTRSTLIQLNQDQPPRLYDTAEVTYYVVAGEGAVRMNGRDIALAAGSFVSIPRGTAHALVRRGRRPLILLATVSGTPCEEPR
jgi:mannose-6-phosphate isomerase-like protein (cupin superfamily)